MNIEYIARNNVQLDDRLRQHVEEKLRKVTKFLDEPIEVRVTLDIEKHRHIAELHVAHRLGVVQATEETDGLLVDAINLAIDKAGRQASRSRQKLVDKRRRAGDRGDRNNGHRWPLAVLDQASVGAGVAPRVIESTHLQIKPMTIEEAALQLEGAKEGFVVFRDAASERVSVLYRREDKHYGLIAPEL
jgi:putative sigma-54 modulation protein